MNCPVNFDEINTNKASKSILIHEFDKNENKSRLLVYGVRGIGKKTMVRLFLKERNYAALFIDVNPFVHSEQEVVDVLCALERNPCNVRGNWTCLVLTGFDSGFQFGKAFYTAVSEKINKRLKKTPVVLIVNVDDPSDGHVVKIRDDLKLDKTFVSVSMHCLSKQELNVMIKALLRASTKSSKPVIYNSAEIDEIMAKCDGSFDNCSVNVKRHLKMKNKRASAIDTTAGLQIYKHEEVYDECDIEQWIQKKHSMPATLDEYADSSDVVSMYDCITEKEEDECGVKSVIDKMPSDVYLYYLQSAGLVTSLATSVFIKNGALEQFRQNIAKYGLVDASVLRLISDDLSGLFKKYDEHQEKIKKAEEFRQRRQLDDGYKRELYIGRHVEVVEATKQPQQKPPSSKKRKLETGQATLDMIFFNSSNKNKHKNV